MALADLHFDNRFTADLRADPSVENRPRQVAGAAYSRVTPRVASAPKLIAHSAEVAALLGIDEATIASDEFAQAMSGSLVVDGMEPHAACYGGHQFGNWAGQLGDGRAIALGEVMATDGSRQTLQLKGAGPTPYSRNADGLAVLRSSVREFLCSEAMHHLGVPTTRALSLTLTGDEVMRDMFYDGHPELEPGAVVCRMAPSFIRFGSFEIFRARDDLDNLKRLLDHTVTTHFAHLGKPSTETYLALFDEVVERTVEMIVHWQRVGFVHGVMNTDNMSIHGITIDYGPYGWLEDYDPDWTPNTTDAGQRRYRFGQQPAIAQWNLGNLANAIHPLIGEVEPLQESLNRYVSLYNEQWAAMMATKLGLARFDAETDEPLISALLDLLPRTETDMTIFFRALAELPAVGGETVSDGAQQADRALVAPLREAYYMPEALDGYMPEALDGYMPEALDGEVLAATASWVRDYQARLRTEGRSDEERKAAMNRVNPKYVLRNYLAQLAIDDATNGSHAPIAELLDVLRRPYDEQPGRESYAAKRPDWARTRAGCSMLSCSS